MIEQPNERSLLVIFDFWWCLSWVSKSDLLPCSHALHAADSSDSPLVRHLLTSWQPAINNTFKRTIEFLQRAPILRRNRSVRYHVQNLGFTPRDLCTIGSYLLIDGRKTAFTSLWIYCKVACVKVNQLIPFLTIVVISQGDFESSPY